MNNSWTLLIYVTDKTDKSLPKYEETAELRATRFEDVRLRTKRLHSADSNLHRLQ